MKAGIVTITNGYNYGNRLQNYAVQEALESRKIQAETIWKTTNVFDTEAPAYIRKLYIKRFLHYHLTKEENRILNFHRFNKTYIKRSSYMIDEQIPEGLDSAYDYFIAGSDQVWNPYLEYCTAANFLSFTEREKKVALTYIHRFTTAILPFTFLGNYISAVENKWLNEEKMINRKTAKICLTVAILFNCFEIWLAGNMGLSEGTAGSFGVLFVILLLFIVLLQNPLTTEGASKAGKFCRDSSILIYGLHPLVLEAIARRIDVTLPETMLWAITIIVLCIVNIVWTKLWKMRS